MRPKIIPSNLPPTAPLKPPSYAAVLAVKPQAESNETATKAWYALAEAEFTHLLGNEASQGDAHCGRADGVSYQWAPLDANGSDRFAGSTPLSKAWRALAAWCIDLAKPKPKSHTAVRNRLLAAEASISAILGALNRKLGDDPQALDFQSLVLQLTPAAMATPDCMRHAAKVANAAGARLENATIELCRKRWRDGLHKGKALSKAAFNHVKSPVGFEPSPIGKPCCFSPPVVVEDAPPRLDDAWQDDDEQILQADFENQEEPLFPLVRGMRHSTHTSSVPPPADTGTSDATENTSQVAMPVQEEQEEPLGLQHATELEANRWARLWGEGQRYVKPQFKLTRDNHPGPITTWMLRAACKTFQPETGLGVDAIQPRALLRLSEVSQQALCRLLMAAELHGEWPELIRTVLIVLIPKDDGGRRPIGLLPTLVRVWSRIRGPIVRSWRSQLNKQYLYGGQARGAQRAAWMQAAKAEVAHMQKRCYGVVLVDLVKAFEAVPHHKVAEAASRRGYPPWVLRLSLDSYRMLRTVMVDGACSRTVLAAQGLTAGSGFATEELCVLMLDVMDELEIELPTAGLALYVDDGTVEVDGSQKFVAESLETAIQVLVKGVAQVGLELSKTKSVVMATAEKVARYVARASKVAGLRVLKVKRNSKVLGCGNAAGNRRCTKVLNARLKKARGKGRRVRSLRGAGVDTGLWQKLAGNPAMMYGADTCGIADSMLEKQRITAAAAASAPGAGKQKDVALWYADAKGFGTDPAFAAHELPFTSLAKAAWEGWWLDTRANHGSLLSAGGMGLSLGECMRRATQATTARGSKVWSAVTGPFAAVAASAARLGWVYVSGLSFRTDAGEVVDLVVDSPQAVKLRVRRSVARWRARRIDEQLPFLRLGGQPPLYAGIRASAKPPKPREHFYAGWKTGCASHLKSAVTNGQWPQARLHSAKLTQDSRCQLCQVQVGTLEHRRCCTMTRPTRGDVRVPGHLLQVFGELAPDQQRLLLTRGLMAQIDLSEHKPLPEDSFAWTIMPPGGILMQGWKVYLDGSFRDGPSEDLGRAGWGFIAFDENGKLQAAAFGVPPPWIRSIHGAEMWAFFAAARCAVPGARYRSDRKAVVDTFRKGKRIATAASDEHARLWLLIYSALDDGDGTELVWTPAHTTKASVGQVRLSDGTFLTERDRAANDAADVLAKRGAAMHRVPSEIRDRVKARDELLVWASRSLGMGTMAANSLVAQDGKSILRDSSGLTKHSKERKKAEADRKRSRTLDGSIPDVISHPFVQQATVDFSSSEEEELILERVGPPPSIPSRMAAHSGRAAATEASATQRVIDAVSRRIKPRRAPTDCPGTVASRAVALQTLTAVVCAPTVIWAPRFSSDRFASARSTTQHVAAHVEGSDGSLPLVSVITTPSSSSSRNGVLTRPVREAPSSASASGRRTAAAVASLLS